MRSIQMESGSDDFICELSVANTRRGNRPHHRPRIGTSEGCLLD